MTFKPQAKIDPNRLEEAVRKVDFTPTGVRVWLRGRLEEPGSTSPDGHRSPARLVVESSGQEFLLVADRAAGERALEALRAAPANSIIVFGLATRPDEKRPVTVLLEGTDSGR